MDEECEIERNRKEAYHWILLVFLEMLAAIMPLP